MENLAFESPESTTTSRALCSSSPTLRLTELLRELNRFRMTGTFCDAVLATEDGAAYRVHKIAMSWCSDYFRVLFTTPLIDKKEKMRRTSSRRTLSRRTSSRRTSTKRTSKTYFIIPGVSSTTLETIIKFAYSGIVDVHQDNVNDLLPAADQFNVPGVVEGCVAYLLENLSADNCVGVWRFGKDYFMESLEEESFRFLLRFFPHISSSSDEFLKLRLSLIEDILNSNSLNAPSELMVWTAVKRWCRYTWADRNQFVPQLVQCVRLALLPVDDFRQLMDDPWIFRSARCRTRLDLVSRFLLGELRDKSEVLGDDKAVLMFTPRHPHEVIVAGGGWTLGGPTNVFEVYDCRANLWKMMLIEDFGVRSYHQTVSLYEFVYVIGGNMGHECLNTCWRIDTKTLKVEEIPPMQEMRCYLSATCLDDKIYAIGGFDGFDRLRTVEYYDSHQNQWTYISPMNERRSDAGSASLRHRIFVAGGFDGDAFLQSAECYYAEFDRWFLLPPMLNRRSGLGCAALGDALYAIGGYDGHRRLRSVEKYCLDTRQWIATRAMKLARSNFAVALLENKIYVMGGYNDEADTVTELSECFDPSKVQWFSIAPMNVARSGLCACTLSGIRDITPYIKDDRFRCLLKEDVSGESTDVCS